MSDPKALALNEEEDFQLNEILNDVPAAVSTAGEAAAGEVPTANSTPPSLSDAEEP